MDLFIYGSRFFSILQKSLRNDKIFKQILVLIFELLHSLNVVSNQCHNFDFLDDVILFETFIFCTWCFSFVVPLIFATLLYSIFASILNLSILKIENSSFEAFLSSRAFLISLLGACEILYSNYRFRMW